MRVLHVITGLGVGGAETQLRSLLRHTRHGSDVATLHNAGSTAEALRNEGVRVIDLRMHNNRDVGVISRLLRIVRAGRYDVVHAHLYRASVYGRLVGRLAGTRVVLATEHSVLDGQVEGRKATPAVRRLYRSGELCGDLTIAVSQAVRAELLAWGIPDRRITVLPNGLELDELTFDAESRTRVRSELGIAPRDRVIGTVGRLHPGKRVQDLVFAAAPLLTRGTRLLVVGDGSERRALEGAAASAGVAGQVLFAGERAAAPLLSAMDVYASCSPRETFGLAIVEAVANGLPTAYLRCPALEELPTPVASAIRFDSAGAQLRDVLTGLLALDPSARRSCPPQLAPLGMARVVAAVDDLYEAVADRRPRQRVGT